MNNFDDEQDESTAVILGRLLRKARKSRGITISDLADKIGRPREWLNRIELGYSEYGQYKPATRTDIQAIIDCIGDSFDGDKEYFMELADKAEREFESFKKNNRKSKRNTYGKLTHTEVILGEKQIIEAILDLINEQHSDAIIRNTGIKSLGNYQQLSDEWKKYRNTLGDFLSKNPNGLFKRVEYAATAKQLRSAKEADEKLAGNRKLEDTHNAKIKFQIQNSLQLHVVIGQREAILALPQTSGQAGSNIALLIRDRMFVEALRVWYDEVLWDAPINSKSVDFTKFDESFEVIANMYGFNKE